MAEKTRIKIKLVKGMAGCRQTHRDTVRGLGLKRLHQTVELEDTAAVRGMINKVFYLVRVEA
jgi:large subunit ribosomal protein L30